MVYHDKSSLGQNFIKYHRLVEELVQASDLEPNDFVIEIGAGKGIITDVLSKKVNKVWAIEKDEKLVTSLNIKFQMTNVQVFSEDILKFELPIAKYKIFANIPFAITSEIINKILISNNLPESMYLIMQYEAAQKFEGGKVETLSSILTKPWYEVEILGEIDRTSFTLKPQIKIVFVKFIKRYEPFIKDDDKNIFRKFVTYGFSAWKATVMQAFDKVLTYEQQKRIGKMLKIGKEKPSELSFDKWLLMFKMWIKVASEEQKRIIKRG